MTFTEADWTEEFGAKNSVGHAVRSGSVHNCGPGYDPEGLLSGAELAAGLSYREKRDWPSREAWIQACLGKIDTNTILKIAPRRK